MSKKEKTKSKELSFEVELRGQESVPARSVPFWNAVDFVLTFVPSYRETRQGRKNARGARIVILAAGILIMAFGGAESGLWIAFGVFLAASALAFPVPELKKRGWRTTVNQKRSPRMKTVWSGGKIVFDGRRVELHDEKKKVRHILVNRDKHEVVVRENEGSYCLGVLPPGQRKKENIWVCATGSVEVDVEPEGEVGASEMDRPAKADPADWMRLWNALDEL